MANLDAPRGFTPVKMLDGGPLTGQVRTIGPADGADIFIGDLINLESGLADPAVTTDVDILGVVVGVGKEVPGSTSQGASIPDPSNLNLLYYDDSASTHTDYTIYYVPVKNLIMSVQTAVDLSASVVGSTVDLTGVNGNTATGRSIMEVTTSSNTDLTIVELPEIVGNDLSLINATVYVMVDEANQAFHV
jgi:hypothetical protein